MSDNGNHRSVGKSIVTGILGLLSLAYLVNPTAGFLEFIPDNFPFVGNLDEAGAAAILIASLAYFGLDITKLFGGGKKGAEKPVSGKVVED